MAADSGGKKQERSCGHLLIAHGGLAGEMLNALEFIAGKRENYRALAIDHALEVDKARRIVEEAVDALMGEAGVLVFTDLFGGAPSNIALSLMGERNMEIVAGVNLPMLLRSVTLEAPMGLKEKAELLRDYGRNNIFIASEVLSGRMKR